MTNLCIAVIILVDGSIDMLVTMNLVFQVMSFFFIAHFCLLILSRVLGCVTKKYKPVQTWPRCLRDTFAALES